MTRAGKQERLTDTATGTGDVSIALAREATSTSTAPDPSSWNTTNDARARAASRSDFVINAAFGGSSTANDCAKLLRRANYVSRK